MGPGHAREGSVDRKDMTVLDREDGTDHCHLSYHYNRYHVSKVGCCDLGALSADV